MSDSLMGARLKLRRARDHLEELGGELAAFAAGNPYRVTHKPNADGSEHIFRAQVLKEPPLSLSVIIGDALQNMRSALDHLAWGLWPEEFRAEFERSIYFPIYTSEAAFFRTEGKRHARGSGAYKIHKLGVKPRTAIQELQPYKSRHPEHDPLWLLHELARIDRHQSLRLMGAHSNSFTQSWRKKGQRNFSYDLSLIRETRTTLGAFQDGTEVGYFLFNEPEMEVNLQLTPYVAFRDEGAAKGRHVLGTLTKIRRHIERGVIPKLERYF